LTGVAPPINIRTFNNTIDAAYTAIVERVLLVKDETCDGMKRPPLPITDHFTKTLDYIVRHFKRTAPFCNPLTHRAYALSFQAPKQQLYLKACDSLDLLSLRRKDFNVKVFLKYEKNDVSKKIVVPRVISPRGPRAAVSLGRYIKPIEHRIYEEIYELYVHSVVMKCKNELQRAVVLKEHWDHFNEPVAIGFDATRFDAHVHKEALNFEHDIYKTFYPTSRKLGEMLKWQIVNKCYANLPNGVVSYVTTSRMSGDVNTSLGNVLIACSMVHALLRDLSISGRLVNDGDDCVLIVERRDYRRFIATAGQWFLDMGFTMIFEDPVYEFEKIEFCQCQPINVGGEYLMVRNPRKSIPKDAVSLVPLSNRTTTARWLAAVGLGGLHKTGGVPILQSFYSMYVRAANGASPLKHTGQGDYIGRYGVKLERKTSTVTDDTRYSFWLAFGISPEEQLAIEGFYDNLDISCESSREYRYVTLPL
jgi:hypothetical protein